MGTTRRHFTDEFKREAVGLLTSSGRPLSQIARELGIVPSMLRAWRDTNDSGVAGGSVTVVVHYAAAQWLGIVEL
jgi:transposase